MDKSARLVDLMRQGFMKPLKKGKAKADVPWVACDRCRDWHRKGRHTKPKDPAK